MDGEVKLRSYRDGDYLPALAITLEAWGYYHYLSPGDAAATAACHLCGALAGAELAVTAEAGGEVIGFLLAGRPGSRPARPLYLEKRRRALGEIRRSRQGSFQFRNYLNTQRLEGRLLAASGRPFEAALSLFAVKADRRGLGVGSALYAAFLDWLRAEGMSCFYLFTDSSSDFRFYERRGLERIGGEVYPWKGWRRGSADYPETYFVYAGRA